MSQPRVGKRIKVGATGNIMRHNPDAGALGSAWRAGTWNRQTAGAGVPVQRGAICA
jgi:hypothetical protein